jgi:hypothetical protein
MSAAENPAPRAFSPTRTEDSRGLVLKYAANELVFAVVGHVGSGTSEIAGAIQENLSDPTLPGGPFQAQILKASMVIKEWARERGESVPDRAIAGLDYTTKLQDLGDKMRDEKTKNGDPDYSAVALS